MRVAALLCALRFLPGGTLTAEYAYYVNGVGHLHTEIVGPYPVAQAMHVRNVVDLDADTWMIYIDGTLVHAMGFGHAPKLSMFRFVGRTAAIDNIVLICGEVQELIVDVKPGSDENPVNLTSKGDLPVAILSSEVLSAGDVDPATLSVGDGAGHLAYPSRSSEEDVNGDGLTDLILHISVPDLVRSGALHEDTTSLDLRGETYEGIPVMGKDSVRIVPAHR